MLEPVDYWNATALDRDVDEKYICDVPVENCLKDLIGLHGRVLEIGCGVGRLMQPGYFGIDISKNMLAIAQDRRPECCFYLCDGSIPFADNMFDSVYSYLVFQHLKIDVIKGYIDETARVLSKLGLFVFQFIEGTESEPFSNHYSREEIEALLFDAGFFDMKFKSSHGHPQWTICQALVG